MPYELIETSLASAFFVIWAFIGLTMLRDQLLAVRRERLEEGGHDGASTVRGPASARWRASRSAAAGLSRRPAQRPVGG